MPVLRPALRYGPAWFALGLLLVAGIVVGSLLPTSNLPDLDVSDKFEHALAYTLLAFWYGSIVGRRALAATFVALLAFGGAMELLQGWMGLGRTADLMDLVANAIGILVGLLLSQTPLGSWAQQFESLFASRPSA
jgi:VanZ family protein